MIAIKIAFSWTCHPNKNEVNAHKTIHLINKCGFWGDEFHSFINNGNINTTVHNIVKVGVIFGNTELDDSWTKPLVVRDFTVAYPKWLPKIKCLS